MRYVSEERLRVIANAQYGKEKWLLENIIKECKELPPPQWQTIEEFRANPVEGWCWVKEQGYDDIFICHHMYGLLFRDMDDNLVSGVIHVMPIKTPEATK